MKKELKERKKERTEYGAESEKDSWEKEKGKGKSAQMTRDRENNFRENFVYIYRAYENGPIQSLPTKHRRIQAQNCVS